MQLDHNELTSVTAHFQTLQVDVTDATFSTSNGDVQPYGQAWASKCSRGKRGSTMVDLQRTGFAIDTQEVDLEECIALRTETQ